MNEFDFMVIDNLGSVLYLGCRSECCCYYHGFCDANKDDKITIEVITRGMYGKRKKKKKKDYI